jgi:hypothetical protein
MYNQHDFINSLRDIAESNLLKAPSGVKCMLPRFFRRTDVTTFAWMNEQFFMLLFLDPAQKRVLREATKSSQGFPFPYLFKPPNVVASVGVRFNNSRYIVLDTVRFNNIYCFDLGKDCSIIINNLKQTISGREYNIDFAYIISFGDQINVNNLPNVLEDLIAYSIKHWRGGDGN